MWTRWSLMNFSEQATFNSTMAGKLWYVLVYIFRFVAAMSIGGAVYSDEQSQFQCSTVIVGCQNVCFDQFSKISQLRFWAFQLLALNFPVVLFHLFVLHEKSNFQENSATNGSYRSSGGPPSVFKDDCQSRKFQDNFSSVKLHRSIKESSSLFKEDNPPRTSSSRKYSTCTEDNRRKTIYTEYGPREIVITKRLELAYFIATIFRFLIELLFLYFSYQLFTFKKTKGFNFLDVIWSEVPRFYQCTGLDVALACKQHMLNDGNGFVPCWVSRPWEKTLFLRYMSIMSMVGIYIMCLSC